MRIETSKSFDTVRRFELVLKICRLRSLSAAAKEMHMAKSTASQLISQLQNDLGFQLFIRRTNGLVPTKRLETDLPKFRTIVDTAKELLDPGCFSPETLTGQFTIMAADNAYSLYVAPVMKTILAKAPLLQIHIISFQNPEEANQELLNGHIDLAIHPYIDTDPQLRYLILSELRFRLLVRKEHPLAALYKKTGELHLHDLKPYAQIFPNFNVNRVEHVPWADAWRNGELHGFAAPYFYSSGVLTPDSDFVAWVPDSVIDRMTRFIRNVVSIPIDDREGEVFSPRLYWSERGNLDPANQWIRSVIFDQSRNLRQPADLSD